MSIFLAAVVSFLLSLTMTINAIFVTRRIRESRRANRNHPDPRPGEHSILGAPALTFDGTRTDASEGTSTRVAEEPVKGWKLAKVRRGADGTLTFDGMSYGTYGVESVAKCERDQFIFMTRPHAEAVPSEKCSCGFHAYNDPALCGDPGGEWALLEVELYGKVVCYEKGYRAEKQRVLSVTARPTCAHIVQREVFHPYGNHQELQPCGQVAGYTNANGPVCVVHAFEHRSRFYEWTPEPVNCETEWRWVL